MLVERLQQTGLDSLLQKGAVWRGDGASRLPHKVYSSGQERLDELLGGGWPAAALTEFFSVAGTGLSLLVPVLARLSKEKRWLAWINPPYVPYAPELAARGIDTSSVLLLRDLENKQGLWAMEQALRSGNCAVVMHWTERISPAQLRRLQLAAEAGNCMAVLFRPLKHSSQSSTAALRLQVDTGRDGLVLKVLKQRGNWAGGSLQVCHSGEDQNPGGQGVDMELGPGMRRND